MNTFQEVGCGPLSRTPEPILITASLIPSVGMFLVLLLVRNTPAVEKGLVRRILTRHRIAKKISTLSACQRR